MDWLGFLPVTPRSSTSHPRLNPLPANGRIGLTSCRNSHRVRRAAFGCIRGPSGAGESENPGKEAVCV